jgi:hypothetical protein
VTTRSDPAEFIRTLVEGNYEATGRYEQRLDEQGWAGFPRFLGTVFFLAVERRFGADNRGEIIRFVADLRARGGEETVDVDPHTAETTIRKVFDPALRIDVDQTAIGRIQTLVVHKILTEENLSPAELDTFLGEAEEFAAGRSA